MGDESHDLEDADQGNVVPQAQGHVPAAVAPEHNSRRLSLLQQFLQG